MYLLDIGWDIDQFRIFVQVFFRDRKLYFRGVLNGYEKIILQKNNRLKDNRYKINCNHFNPYEIKKLLKLIQTKARENNKVMIAIPHDVDSKDFQGHYEIKFMKIKTITVELDTPGIIIC